MHHKLKTTVKRNTVANNVPTSPSREATKKAAASSAIQQNLNIEEYTVMKQWLTMIL